MLKGITQHGLLPILGLAFKLGLLIVTAINTYAILYLVGQDRIWAVAALILFEVGLIYWWLVFKNDVEVSVVQMSISLMMFIASLLLVLAANALHLGAISVDVLGAGTIAKVVIIAILLNLSASLLYPLASPEHIAALMKQIAIGLVWAKAQGNVMANLDQLAAQTQTELEARMWQTIRGQINQTAASRLFGDGDGDDEGRPVVIEGASTPLPRPARRTFRDRMFGRRSDDRPAPAAAPSVADMVNSTHTADSAAASPASGQGDTPTLSAAQVAALLAMLTPPPGVPTPHANGQEPKTANP